MLWLLRLGSCSNMVVRTHTYYDKANNKFCSGLSLSLCMTWCQTSVEPQRAECQSKESASVAFFPYHPGLSPDAFHDSGIVYLLLILSQHGSNLSLVEWMSHHSAAAICKQPGNCLLWSLLEWRCTAHVRVLESESVSKSKFMSLSLCHIWHSLITVGIFTWFQCQFQYVKN